MTQSLTLILDRELPDPFGISEDLNFYDTSLYLTLGDKLIPINIRTWTKYCRATNEKFSKSVQQTFGNKKKIIAEFDKQIGKSYRQKLLAKNSKLTLNILLNSPGGHNVALKSILDIIEFIKSNGGIVNSFSFILVASAASYIFSYTDKRYCLKLSEFMCHSSVTVPELESVFENTVDEEEISRQINFDEYKEHLDKFFEKHKLEALTRINEIKEEALTKNDCSLYLGGYNLETLGIVEKAFYDFNELLNLIETTIGKATLKNERVSSFIKQMASEYKSVLDDNTKYTQKLPGMKCPK